MAVASGHGVGKSTVSAWITDWIMSTRARAKGTITANTFQQLSTRTWAQLTQWTKLCFTSRWFTLTIDQMYYRNAREAWFVSAQSCKEENSEAFAGQHAADSTSFYIFDEASGVSDKIFEVAEGGLTDGEPMIFLFGNPTRAEGKFFRVNFGSEPSAGSTAPSIPVSAASLIRTSSNSGSRITARIPISAACESRANALAPAPASSSLMISSLTAASSAPKVSTTCPRSSAAILPVTAMTAPPSSCARASRPASWANTAASIWLN
jgi:hypothetical protein